MLVGQGVRVCSNSTRVKDVKPREKRFVEAQLPKELPEIPVPHCRVLNPQLFRQVQTQSQAPGNKAFLSENTTKKKARVCSSVYADRRKCVSSTLLTGGAGMQYLDQTLVL